MGSLAPAVGFENSKEEINVLVTGFGVRCPSKKNLNSRSLANLPISAIWREYQQPRISNSKELTHQTKYTRPTSDHSSRLS